MAENECLAKITSKVELLFSLSGILHMYVYSFTNYTRIEVGSKSDRKEIKVQLFNQGLRDTDESHNYVVCLNELNYYICEL